MDAEQGRFRLPEIGEEARGGYHPHHWARAQRVIDAAPSSVRPALLSAYAAAYAEGGESGALENLDAAWDTWGGFSLSLSASDSEIRDYAQRRAAWVFDRMHAAAVAAGGMLRDWLARVLARDGLDLPDAQMQGLIARLVSPRWWARKLRSVVMRRVEAAAIRSGLVHIRAGVYCSHATVARHGQAARRNAAALERATATNEAGQSYSVAELAALGVANPEIRRTEMMVRIRGVEELATNRGWRAYFVTWTCPSAYHARTSPEGGKNPAHVGATPRDAQAYLTRQWAKARAKLARGGMGDAYMGIRVAEPHHDGTPHWHLLIFCSELDWPIVRDVMRAYALAESPDEPGAGKHRFAVEAINRGRGSAVGYIAKYIAKSVDGAFLADDVDTGAGRAQETGLSGAQGAERAVAWARTWGIRQFQFFGVPNIGPWRELRRVRALEVDQLDFFDAWNAADRGEFADYCEAVQKAPCAPIKECRESVYPGEFFRAVVGLEMLGITHSFAGPVCRASRLITRVHTWEIKWGRGSDGVPRTCVNNCTGVEDGQDRGKVGKVAGGGGNVAFEGDFYAGGSESVGNGNAGTYRGYGERVGRSQYGVARGSQGAP